MLKKLLKREKTEVEKVETIEEEKANKEKEKLEEDLELERQRLNMCRANIRINKCVDKIVKMKMDLSSEIIEIDCCSNETSIIARKAIKKLYEKYDEHKDKSDDDYIWVEGYKGTDNLMRCRDEKFELNKEFTIEGDPVICENGYHFCLELPQVFNYYGISNTQDKLNRYFKVKCLVKKRDYMESKIGNLGIRPTYYNRGKEGVANLEMEHTATLRRKDKLVAKTVIFTEELGFKDLEEFFKERQVLIQDENSYLKIMKEKISPIDNFMNEAKESLKKYVSPILATVLVDELYDKHSEYKISINSRYRGEIDTTSMERDIDKFVGLIESGVSKDMAIYLFMKGM